MMRKLSLLLAFVVCCGLKSIAQECGFDFLHHQMLANDPAYAARVNAMNAELAQVLSNNANNLVFNNGSGTIYEIPVVIHVVHTGGILGSAYNPTDLQLQQLIAYLNQTYSATYSGYPGVGTGGTAFPVQFALAKRDPNCNATNGIERINGATVFGTGYVNTGINYQKTTGISDATLKANLQWNRRDYYNIYIVNKIDSSDGTLGGVLGYAYLPPASPTLDAMVLLAQRALAGYQTLPHEIGHAFNLLHTFEGDDPGNTGAATTCPPNVAATCAITGDSVCDTEPHRRNSGACPSNSTINTCTGTNWIGTQFNFMDYSTCRDRFTPGQRTRFLAAMNLYRGSLLSSLGATALGTAPFAYQCIPTSNNPFNAFDAGPREVLLNDLVGTSEGGYNADGNSVFLDRACWQRANLTAGQTYTISVKTGINAEKVRVYMDWNNDGIFNAAATPSELVYSHTGTASYETHTGSVLIPASGITTCVPIRMRVVSDLASASVAPTPCGGLDAGQAEDYSLVIKSAPGSVITVSQTTGSNPSCVGTNIGFTANYTGTPTSPSVKIYVNGTQVSATNTYSASSLNNGDIITAKLFFTGSCGADSITSANFTVSRTSIVAPSVSIAVTGGNNPGCAGQSLTLTATPTNGGTAPTYKWFVNGVQVVGATTNTLSFTPACGDVIFAQLTSNSPCASTTTASSSSLTYNCGPQAISVTIAITGGSNPTCSGRTVTFAATPTNGGATPGYQWYVNGAPVAGAVGATFSTNTLSNLDSVKVQLTSSSSCAATPSTFSPNTIVNVVPSVTPSVTKAITVGSNPGCINDLLQLTATTANAGATPAYRWFLNGVAIPFATTNVYNNTTGVTGDKIWVRIVAANPGSSCYTKDTAYSDTITLDRRAVPSLPVISFIGHQLVSDSANVQWWGPAGLLPGATGATFTPTVQGDYYAVIIGPLCGTGKSNVLTVSPLVVGSYNLTGVKMYPNPTTGLFNITWSSAATTRLTVYTAAGKAVMHDMATLAMHKTLDLSGLPSGIYFVQLQDESGKSGVVRVTLSH